MQKEAYVMPEGSNYSCPYVAVGEAQLGNDMTEHLTAGGG